MKEKSLYSFEEYRDRFKSFFNSEEELKKDYKNYLNEDNFKNNFISLLDSDMKKKFDFLNDKLNVSFKNDKVNIYGYGSYTAPEFINKFRDWNLNFKILIPDFKIEKKELRVEYTTLQNRPIIDKVRSIDFENNQIEFTWSDYVGKHGGNEDYIASGKDFISFREYINEIKDEVKKNKKSQVRTLKRIKTAEQSKKNYQEYFKNNPDNENLRIKNDGAQIRVLNIWASIYFPKIKNQKQLEDFIMKKTFNCIREGVLEEGIQE